MLLSCLGTEPGVIYTAAGPESARPQCTAPPELTRFQAGLDALPLLSAISLAFLLPLACAAVGCRADTAPAPLGPLEGAGVQRRRGWRERWWASVSHH